MFFHALTFAGPEEVVWTRGCQGECSNCPRDPTSVNVMKQT